MKKTNTEPNKQDFADFLSHHIFKEDILSFYQFKRGASSFNYLVELKSKKVLVKLAWKYDKQGVERLAKIISALSNKHGLPVAKLLTYNNQTLFQYQNSYGFVLEYIDGVSLKATDITSFHIKQILNAYKQIEPAAQKHKTLLMPALDLKKIQKSYLRNIKEIETLFKRKKLSLLLLSKLKNELINIGHSPLQILTEKQSIIHGDFHHNNLLFKDNKLAAILDLEDLGYGYKTEDLLRFLLCQIARFPLLYPKKKTINAYLNLITKEFSYSYDEWMVGLNSFTLQKMKKLFSNPKNLKKNALKKMIQLIVFMRLYHYIEQQLKQILTH